MDLQDAVNAVYTKALAAKRFMDREATCLLLEDTDTSQLTAEALNLVQRVHGLLEELKRLTAGLNTLSLGELKQLCVQLKIEPVPTSKDLLIKSLLLARKRK